MAAQVGAPTQVRGPGPVRGKQSSRCPSSRWPADARRSGYEGSAPHARHVDWA